MPRELPLTQGLVALLDDKEEAIALLAKYREPLCRVESIHFLRQF